MFDILIRQRNVVIGRVMGADLRKKTTSNQNYKERELKSERGEDALLLIWFVLRGSNTDIGLLEHTDNAVQLNCKFSFDRICQFQYLSFDNN